MDNEIKGTGNSVNFKYRVHDPRLGRFLSIDPLAPKYPGNSPYAFSENRVIDSRELEGLERTPAGKDPKYDHLFRGDWTKWKEGNNVWYRRGEEGLPFMLYQGTQGHNTLVTRDLSSGFSLSYPDQIIPKMDPIVADNIPYSYPSPVPQMTNSVQILASNSNSGRSTSGYSVPLGIEENLNINFQGSSGKYEDKDYATESLKNIVQTLKQNPNLEVTLRIKTSLGSDDISGKQYLKSREINLKGTLNSLDPDLDYSRVHFSREYNKPPSVTSEYSEIK